MPMTKKKKKIECAMCGQCCKSVSVAIDDPEDAEDWDELLWMLHHENLWVYLDNEDEWCVEFKTSCRHLDSNNGCKIYEERPNLCREYNADECERNGEGSCYKVVFRNAEDLKKYLDENNIEH